MWRGTCEYSSYLFLWTAYFQDGREDVLVGLVWSVIPHNFVHIGGPDLSGSDVILRHRNHIWARG